jgi:hypothetical protein
MASYLQKLKEKHPDLAQYYSDDEIIDYLPKYDPAKFKGLDRDTIKQIAIDERGAIRKGFDAGVDQAQAIGGGLTALAGDAMGIEPMREYGMEVFNRNMGEASLSAPEVEFGDFQTLGDVANWAGYTVGNLAPMMLPSLLSGGIGGLAVKPAANAAAKALATNMLAKGASEEAIKAATASLIAKRVAIGQAVGAYTASAGMESGSIYGDTEDAAVSTIHGLIAGSFDALPVARILGKFGAKDVAKEAIETSVIRELFKQGTLEGGTEGIQTLVEQHAKYWVENDGKSLFANAQDIDWNEVIQATAAGALGGGVMGAGAGLLSGDPIFFRKPETGTDDPDDEIEKAGNAAKERGGDNLDAEIAKAFTAIDVLPRTPTREDPDTLRAELASVNARLAELNQAKPEDKAFSLENQDLTKKAASITGRLRASLGIVGTTDGVDDAVARARAALSMAPSAPATIVDNMPSYAAPATRPERDMTAADLGARLPESRPVEAPSASYRGDEDIDRKIILAERLGYTDEATKLASVKRLNSYASTLESQGNTAGAQRVRQRAQEVDTAVSSGRLGQEIARRSQQEAAAPETPTDRPIKVWTGRRGDGYYSKEAAEQGLPKRQQIDSDLNWKIEQMPSGSYQLAGYARPTVDTSRPPEADVQIVESLEQQPEQDMGEPEPRQIEPASQESTIPDMPDRAASLNTAIGALDTTVDPERAKSEGREYLKEVQSNRAQRNNLVAKTIGEEIDSGSTPVFQDGDVYRTVSRSTRNPGKYQVTAFNQNGAIGDTEVNTLEDASREIGSNKARMLPRQDAEAAMQKIATGASQNIPESEGIIATRTNQAPDSSVPVTTDAPPAAQQRELSPSNLKQGTKFTFSNEFDYAKAGEEYTVTSAGKKQIRIESSNGSSTYLNTASLSEAHKRGDVKILAKQVETDPQADTIPQAIPATTVPAQSVSAISQDWKERGIESAIYEKDGVITLGKIVVPKERRGQGAGTAAMKELAEYADKTGQVIALSPSSDFGGNKSRLEGFYKGLGFVSNSGRGKDFTISETMIRMPQSPPLRETAAPIKAKDQYEFDSASIRGFAKTAKNIAEIRKYAKESFGEERAKAVENIVKVTWNARLSDKRKAVKPDDTLAVAVAKLGGISPDWKMDIAGDTKGNKIVPGVGAVFQKGGTSPDDMALKLFEHGYITRAQLDDMDARDFVYDAIKTELGGGKGKRQLTSEKDVEDAIRGHEDMLEQQAMRQESEKDSMYSEIAEEYGERVADIARQFDDDMIDYNESLQSLVDYAAESQIQSQREEEYEGYNQASAEAERAGGYEQVGKNSEQAGRREGGEAGADQQPEEFSLEVETEDQRFAREKAAQEKAESDRAARAQAESKAQADAEVNDFVLSGSNAPADVAASRGQNDLFVSTRGQKAEPAKTAEKPTVTPQVLTNSSFNGIIQIAADSIDKLRAVDVARVIEETPISYRADMAKRIKQERPDLATEVDEVSAETDMGRGKAEPSVSSKTAQANNDEAPSDLEEDSPDSKQTKIEAFGDDSLDLRRGRDKAGSLGRDISDADIASLPLSKIWPKEELDAIEDNAIAAFATAARAEIPSKPRKSYAVARWVEKVKTLRGLVVDYMEKDPARVMDGLRKVDALSDFAAKVDLLVQVDRKDWGRVDSIALYPGAGRWGEDGTFIPSPFVAVSIDGKRQRFDDAKTVADVVDRVRAALNQSVTPAAESKMKFTARGQGSSFYIHKDGDTEYRRLREFSSAKEALDYLKNNHAELVAAWERVKERDNVKKSDIRSTENRPRSGADHRKGKDVTVEKFHSTFGLRKVDWGNWVSDKEGERQNFLNEAFDAMMDLASITGLPPKALGLNGALVVTFGKRGSGWAAAHFEAQGQIINLTKTKGAGSLAHEWLHALDNYFQRQRGESSDVRREANFITYSPETYYQHPRGDRIPASVFEEAMAAKKANKYHRIRINTPDDWKKVEGVRPEIEGKFAELVKVLNESPMKARAQKIDKGASNGYWSRIIELAARSFESYVIAKMEKDGYSNDFLANVTRINDFSRNPERYPYLLENEMTPVEDAFDNLFGTMKTRETDKGVALFSRKESDGQNVLAEAWAAIAGNDGVFSYPKSESNDFDEIAKEHGISAKIQNVSHRSDIEKAWRVDSGDGFGFVIQYSDGRLEVSLKHMKKGGSGSAIYSSAGAYAHNNNLIFHSDRLGFSGDTGVSRRLENLASLALKFGSTDFLEPFGKSSDKWVRGDFNNNISLLLKDSYDSVKSKYEWIDNYEYDERTDQFALRANRDGILGSTDGDRESLSDRAGKEGHGFPDRTIKRAIITGTILRLRGGNIPDELLRAYSQIGDNNRILYSRGGNKEKAPRLTRSKNQTFAKVLNVAMAKYLNNPEWRNAYETVDVPDALAEFGKEIKAAFGRTPRFFQPTEGRFDKFNGVYLKGAPTSVYVNAQADVNLTAITGHELSHALEKDRPELYEWFTEQLDQYLKGLPEYTAKLNRLRQEGEKEYTTEDAKKELIGDIMGDAMADPVFLQQMADSNPSKFKGLLDAVIKYLSGIIGKLKNLGSSKYVTDVEALRDKLKTVLNAYADGKQIADVFPDGPGNDARFSRKQTETPAFKKWFDDSKVVDAEPAFQRTDEFVTLYHGTSAENAKSIRENGFNTSFVYLTTDYNAALERFADDTDSVIEVTVPKGSLLIDHDLGSDAYLMEVDTANEHNDVDRDIGEWLDEWSSFAVPSSVANKAAARGQQFKSAIGNNGEFDGENPDIRFSRNGGSATGRVGMDESWNGAQSRLGALRLKAGEKMDAFRFHVQDKLIDLRRAQEGVDASDDANPYQKASIWEGKAAERLGEFDEGKVQPLIQKIADTGLSISDVGEWLVARHAEEANAYLAEINPDKPDDERYRLSGMSDEEAATILKDRAGNKHLKEVGEMIDAMNKERVDSLISSGLVSKEEAALWRGRYKHYVPLKREEAQGADHLPSRGQMFNIKGRESKMRTGSAYWSPANIIANTIAQVESSIIREEKNEVGKALLKFVEQNPDSGFWEIDTERTMNAVRNGKVVEVKVFSESDNELSVKVDGKQKIIVFNKANQRAMRLVTGLKNLQATQQNAIFSAMQKAVRFLSNLNTSWNPEFMVSNFFRDAQTAAYNLSSTEIDKLRMKVMKDIPSAMNGIRSSLFGDGSAKWSKDWEQFSKAGGKTGWIDLHNDIKEKERDLSKTIERIRGGKPSQGNIARLFGALENMNTVVENAVRLSVFKNAMSVEGMTEDRAAAIAKDITVNFNRKGNMGPTINAFYMFYNASAQGSVRLLQAMATKKGAKMAAGTMGFAIMLDMINRANSGDDDDGENIYENIPDYVKSHNLIIMGEKEPLIKIPLPWGYNVLHAIGQAVGEAVNGERFSATESAAKIGLAAIDAFNPMGSGTFAQVLAPTIADPIVQIAENKSFSGNPLKPEHTFDYYQPKPEYQMHFSGAREFSKDVAKWLNDNTGGNEVTPGGVNISPEWVDLMIDQVSGGAGRTAANSVDVVAKMIKGEEVPTDNIPFVRRVTGFDSEELGVRSRYYDWSLKVGYAKDERKELSGSDLEEAMKKPEMKMIGIYDQTERVLANLRKVRRQAELSGADKSRIASIDKLIRERMASFNKAYAEKVLN